jgi:predicted nucleic acid-binding protein
MRRFFDTNILVYLFETSAPRKKRLAQDLLKLAVGERVALLSTPIGSIARVTMAYAPCCFISRPETHGAPVNRPSRDRARDFRLHSSVRRLFTLV